MTFQATSSMAPSSPVAIQRSPWHSPVPYLFGGLAAMLALIAFALLILACSYWKLTAQERRDLEAGNGDGEAGEGDSKPDNQKEPPVFEEKYLVIMAGQAKPTFLATPISSRASSFGSCSCRSNSTASTETSSMPEEEKQGSFDQVQVRTRENQETSHQLP
ncbi:protein GLUTAMINE DUMPER 2-like [Cynara cardunculus var. scolymus]|uniref:protein GLUTAMINE DUMPER 2-like n=1 Tax=Cynara cardunculus var. scolymus TaxID=59895 RepID=UPI000D628D56|nr:protein GLUTAMINE DUMPER 2-like [Cynara cardunculus var. scolymus]